MQGQWGALPNKTTRRGWSIKTKHNKLTNNHASNNPSGKVVRYFLETTNTDDPRSDNQVVTEETRQEVIMATPVKEKRDAIARLTKAYNLCEKLRDELQQATKLAEKVGVSRQTSSYLAEAQSMRHQIMRYTEQAKLQLEKA